MDQRLNNLLRWSIENSALNSAPPCGPNPAHAALPAANSTAPNDAAATSPPNARPASGAAATRSDLTPELMATLFGGPSDADLMKAAMAIVTDPSPAVDMDDKLVAFDNFEQLIESLDNANNLESLALWTPLLSMLGHDHDGLRRMAAWCVGTAVQNNAPSQERLLAMGGIPSLVGLATREGEPEAVRRKAIYALSSAVRNYQPAMDVLIGELLRGGHRNEGDKVDATDMDAVDTMIQALLHRS